MTNPEQDKSKCTCKYCAENRQLNISDPTGPFRRQVQPVTITANPKWIEIKVSDADPCRWPDNMSSRPGEEGNVNFFRTIAVEHDAAKKWRVAIGQALAEMLEYPNTGSKNVIHNTENIDQIQTRRKSGMDAEELARRLPFV